MPKYIDVDKTLNRLPNDLPYKSSVKRVLLMAPEADVVPKSEVEELKKIYKKYNKAIRHERVEVAREIFEEIENDYADFLFDGHRNIIVLTEKDYNELKKKYTEDRK